MKKKFIKGMCALTVFSMLFAFTGCGSSSDDADKSNDTKKEESADKNDEADNDSDNAADIDAGNDSSSDVTGSYETVEEYVNSDELQSQLAELKSSLSESGMSIDIKAEGNALIYVYTYETIAKADFDDSMVQTLETGLDDQADTFKEVANSLKEATNDANPVVKIQYVSSDGSVIVQKEYTAD